MNPETLVDYVGPCFSVEPTLPLIPSSQSHQYEDTTRVGCRYICCTVPAALAFASAFALPPVDPGCHYWLIQLLLFAFGKSLVITSFLGSIHSCIHIHSFIMLSNYQSIFSFALCSALCTVALAKPHPQHRHGGGWGPPAPVATSTPAVAAATAATSAASPATSSGTTTTSSSGAVSGKGLIYYSGPPLSAYNAADLAFSLDWADTAAADGASLGTFVPMCSGLAQGESLCLGNSPAHPC